MLAGRLIPDEDIIALVKKRLAQVTTTTVDKHCSPVAARRALMPAAG